MISITINGMKIRLEEPATVLDAAAKHGIDIPTLCAHPVLESYGGCRLCVVEVKDMPGLVTACTLEARDGMVIDTESREITKARKAMLEFLLISHPLDCHRCDKAGECKLQDYTVQYGPAAGRFAKRKTVKTELQDPLLDFSTERCIMCTRCVRMCEDVQGAAAISVVGRGKNSSVAPFAKDKFDCEYCGNCITVCPVGAIMSRLHRYSFRPWQTEQELNTICPHCGVGCSLLMQVREETFQRVVPRVGLGVNQGLLCAKGYFGYGYVSSPMRLTTPLIRSGESLEPASWDEALTLVATKMKQIRDRHGGAAIAGVASARCTNEENYLFQKLLRSGYGSNNVDSIARMGFAGSRKFLDAVLGQGSTANQMADLPASDAILVVGGDPTRVNPVLGVRVRNACKEGAEVITIGHTPGLHLHRTVAVSTGPYAEGTALAGVLSGVLEGRKLPGDNAQLEKFISNVKLPSEEEVGKVCDIDGIKLARKALSGASSVSIVVGRDLAAHEDGGRNLIVLAALAYSLGARLYLMSEEPNENGLLDMGCVPDMLPGERPVGTQVYRKRYEKTWGTPIPSDSGLSLMEIVEEAHKGRIKAMHIMGENPAFNFPNTPLVKAAIERLDFLVVQDIFMTETAEMADVVLPAMSWAEKEGTFVNLERRIQVLKKGVKGKGMEDWKIVSEIGKRIGLDMPYGSAEEIMAEIARISPLHFSLSYDEIRSGMDLWPYMGEPLWQTSVSEVDGLLEKPPVTEREGLNVMLDKPLFTSGTLGRHSKTLGSIYTEPTAGIGPETAEKLSINNGDPVKVSSNGQSIALSARVERGIPEDTVYLTNNFKGMGIMPLFDYNIEPVTKTPVMRGKKVKLEKVSV